MNFKPIYTDFEKRYGTKCNVSYFVGKPVIFLQSNDTVIGTAVSAGGFLTASARDDGRILIQFSHSTKMLNSNITELEHFKNESIFSLLLNMQKFGAKLSGAQILLSSISSLIPPEPLMLLCAANAFCSHTPPNTEFLARFDNYEQNMLSIHSRLNTVTMLKSGALSYLPLPDCQVKILLCYPPEFIGSVNKIPVCYTTDSRTDNAIYTLQEGNYADFGHIVTKHSNELLRKKIIPKASKNLYTTAHQLEDAYCCGFMPDGGIFAIVKNSCVDTFMHNLRSEIERTYGGKPTFFITRSEDSALPQAPPEN